MPKEKKDRDLTKKSVGGRVDIATHDELVWRLKSQEDQQYSEWLEEAERNKLKELRKQASAKSA